MSIKRRQVGLRYSLTYEDVPFNDEGWANPRWYKPLACDLVRVKFISSYDGRIAEGNAWWDGREWAGARLRKKDEVLAWKLSPDSDIGVTEDGYPITTKRERRLKNLPKTEVKYDD